MKQSLFLILLCSFLLFSACFSDNTIDTVVPIPADPTSPPATQSESEEEPEATVSAFLRQQVLEQAAAIDAKHGPDTYGGTNWLLTQGGYTEEELYGIVAVENGEILTEPLAEAVAPLTIQTSGTGGYYVRLEPLGDVETQLFNLMTFYVEGGSDAEVMVPLGTYEIYYATGETWFGETYYFGMNTQYYKCDETFEFTQDAQSVSGYTLTLYPVAGGNMDTDPINKDDFPQ